MNTPNVNSPEPHAVTLLLPAYLNDTLGPAQRREVEQHLSTCEECRAELADTVDLRERTRAMLDAAPSAPASLRAEVMRRIAGQRETDRVSSGGSASSPPARDASPGLLDFLRRLLQPQWAPAAAAVLIVLQAGALSWLALDARGVDTPLPDGVTPRSLAPATAVRVRVTFVPQATEAQMRAGLLALGGKIVDGPGADAAWLVELPDLPPTELAERLHALRGQPGLIERIDHAQ